MWRFTVLHEPGRDNLFSDATSRRRIQSPDDWPSDTTDMEEDLIEVSSNKISEFRAITWDTVKDATASDHNLQKLAHMITQGFPATKPLTCSSTMEEFWRHRDNLHLIDEVIMMGDRIVIPKSLRPEVLQSLHAAHQGVTSMTERARCAVYWPGISKDIDSIRASCYQCNRIAPSQAKLPPVMPLIPTTPFEAVACDFFYFKGRYFFASSSLQTAYLVGRNKHSYSSPAAPTPVLRDYALLFASCLPPSAFRRRYQVMEALNLQLLKQKRSSKDGASDIEFRQVTYHLQTEELNSL